jgi:Calcineurin-like phosphoesterase
MSLPFCHLRRIAAAHILLLLCVCALASADNSDGPYVMRNSSGALEAWSVEPSAEGPRKQTHPLAANAKITVQAVDTLSSFDVRLRGPAEPDADDIKTDPKAPLFVVADTHGEFEILARMLIQHRVVNSKLRWNFGRGHLVLLGDVFDRGPHQTEILWLIYALEAEARKAGGGVHLLVGNHEMMLLQGDQRYLNEKYRMTAQTLGVSSYAALFSADSVLGQWLRTKPAMIKINQFLCLHGGVSAELVERRLTVPQVNSIVRAILDNRPFINRVEAERAEFIAGQKGPLWYRGYFSDKDRAAEATSEDVRKIREYFGVDKILIGHTRVPTITSLYEGEVLAVQVYPRREENGVTTFESLLIRDGKVYRAKPDGQIEEL